MEQIAKDVYHLPLLPRNSINCYLIEDVLIDSGIKSSFKKITRHLKGFEINSHALTHAHADHQGSSAKLCDYYNIDTYCHKKEVKSAETGYVTLEYPNPNHKIAKLQQKYWAGKGCKIKGTLKEMDKIGGFTIIETPGHSKGHISFFREKDGVLILGDVATNMNLLTTLESLHLPPKIFTSEPEENLHSLLKLKSLNAQIICFGHGPVLYNKNKEFEQFIEKSIKT